MLIGLINTPFCYNEPNFWCTDGWGVDSWYATLLKGQITAEGTITGGDAFRAMNFTPVSFIDGHVKTMQPSQMAAGTNWNPASTDASIILTNPSAYLWNTTH
jgi:hypothetical protein